MQTYSVDLTENQQRCMGTIISSRKMAAINNLEGNELTKEILAIFALVDEIKQGHITCNELTKPGYTPLLEVQNFQNFNAADNFYKIQEKIFHGTIANKGGLTDADQMKELDDTIKTMKETEKLLNCLMRQKLGN